MALTSKARDEERKMVRLVAEGNEEAFQWIFNRYYAPLALFASKILDGDDDSAIDIVQNVFVALFQQRKSLQKIDNIRSFLYQSVRNRTLNEIKHLKVVRGFQEYELAASNITPDGDQSTELLGPEELMEYVELQDRIERAIESLPGQCQRIFRMSRMEEMSNDEIALKLNLSKRTVETQISKALKILRQILCLQIIIMTLL
ncbi:MAG: RNA polymerase sigma-70 factor [Marinilabiliaceae bacterium]|nr:RNA polymerase sigma-70 factor [Marinilabiliaceae bacterium]